MKRPAVRIILAPLGRKRGSPHEPSFGAPLQGETSGRTIWIDPRVPLPAKVLLHELIHVRHPGWPEDRVLAAEEVRWSRMTWREKAELYKLLGTAEIQGGVK